MINKICGKQITRSMCMIVMAALFMGCVAVSNSVVKKQVASDKNCPIDQVKVKERKRIDGRCNFEIEACGKNYTYQAAPVVFEKGNEPHGLPE